MRTGPGVCGIICLVHIELAFERLHPPARQRISIIDPRLPRRAHALGKDIRVCGQNYLHIAGKTGIFWSSY